MSEADRLRWDERWTDSEIAPIGEHGPPPVWAHAEHLFPVAGLALEVACGRGRGAMWLAHRGLDYWGVDVSPVAIDLARRLAEMGGVAGRCRFDVHDLDLGLPPGPPVDLLMCHLFRDPKLDRPMMDRLVPGGLLAVAALSEVGAGPGPFRVAPGELLHAFAELDLLDHGEADGMAWVLGRRQTP